MRKKWIILAGVLIVLTIICLVLWQTGLKTATGPKTSDLPLISSRSYWPGQLWKDIAQNKGWFKEAGLKVELVDINPDYYASLTDMIAGKMDSNNFSCFDFIRFNLKGADLVMVVNTDDSFGVDAIVLKPEVGDIRNLKGRKVAVAVDSYSDYLLDVVLKQNDLGADDIVKVNIPPEEATNIFIKGEVDAIVTWEPETSKAVTKGNGLKVFDTSQIPGLLRYGEVFKRSFIEERPNDVKAFLKVWHRTTQFMKEKTEEAYGIIVSIYNVSLDDVKMIISSVKIMDLHQNIIAFNYGTGFDSLYGGARQIVQFFEGKGLIKKQIDITEYFDSRFIRELTR